MINKLIFCFVLAFISSCGDSKSKETVLPEVTEDNSKQTVEKMAERHIESKLSIPATEKYTYKIYKEHLDDDGKIDAIITVNRLEFAMDEASRSNNTAKLAEIGFMGNYNFLFLFDGGLNMISPQIAIPSSPMAELVVSFENIQSDKFKDVLVDFRIKNASYKDYYVISNHIPRRVFQWKNYDGLTSKISEAYYFEYGDGTMTEMKDILVKKAILKQPTKEVDVSKYAPELTKTDELVFRFFYHPKEGKYMTMRK